MKLRFVWASLLLVTGCVATRSSDTGCRLAVDAIIDPCGEILKCESASIQTGKVYCGDALKIVVHPLQADKDDGLTNYMYVLEREGTSYYLNNNCMTGIWHSVQFPSLRYANNGFNLEVSEVPNLGRTLVCNASEKQGLLVKIPINNDLIDGVGMRVGCFRPVVCPTIYKRLPQVIKSISYVGSGKERDVYIAALYADDSGRYALLCSRYTMAGVLKCSCSISGKMGFASKKVEHFEWATTDSTIVESCASEPYDSSSLGFGLRVSIKFKDALKQCFIPIKGDAWNRDLLGGL